MSVPRFALRHGRALGFVSVALAVAGLLVARNMPKAVYPEVSFPREQVVASLQLISLEGEFRRDTVLEAFGFSPGEIAALRAERVI